MAAVHSCEHTQRRQAGTGGGVEQGVTGRIDEERRGERVPVRLCLERGRIEVLGDNVHMDRLERRLGVVPNLRVQ